MNLKCDWSGYLVWFTRIEVAKLLCKFFWWRISSYRRGKLYVLINVVWCCFSALQFLLSLSYIVCPIYRNWGSCLCHDIDMSVLQILVTLVQLMIWGYTFDLPLKIDNFTKYLFSHFFSTYVCLQITLR